MSNTRGSLPILLAMLVLLAVAGCGGSGDNNGASGSPTAIATASGTPISIASGTPTATASRAPSASTSPTAKPSPAATLTVEELTAVAEAMFPIDSFGQYGPCDRGAPPNPYDLCPITARLKARLLELDTTGAEYFASRMCRCQNSSNKRDIVATPEGAGGSVVVTLFDTSHALDLIIVKDADGQLLVDDIFNAGCPQSSWYSDTRGATCGG